MRIRKLSLSIGWAVVLSVLGGLRCQAQVVFNTEIKPLLQRKCLECHGPEKVKSGLRLDSRAAALKGGDDGVAIIPGNSADSPLIHLVEDGDMPSKGAPLTNAEIGLLKRWIDQGARWGGAAPKPKPKPASQPREAGAKPGGPAPKPGEPREPTLDVPVPAAPTPEVVRLSLPPAAAHDVDFTRDIHPLLQGRCLKCHGPEKPKGRFRLDNRESAMKGGASGAAILPGNSADSPLIHFVARLVEDMEMPPEGKGEPLTGHEVGLLRAWIDQGAKWGDPVDTPQLTFTLTPTLQLYSVSGNDQMFREHAWTREGMTGGIGQFTLENWFDLDTRLTAEGTVDAPGNYDLTFELERQEVGFVRGGAGQIRRYYNNHGGYYGPFGATLRPAFSLDRELHLDTGRVWTEIGFRHPDWPEVTLGYEYRFKEGTKSTLLWGPSTQGGETRQVFPAIKRIEQDVHIFRADVSYGRNGLEMENNFMAEFFDLETWRYEASPLNVGEVPDTFSTVKESHDAFQLANTFSLQKEIKEWWLLSGGYYYSYLDADAEFQQSTLDGMGNAVVGDHWFAQPIVLDWNTHMFNLSTRLGPWKDLTLSAGVQNQWQRQKAMGNSTPFFGLPDPLVTIPPFFNSTVSSNKQSVTTTEHAALRYTGIPRTVLFAEAEWQQDNTDYYERDPGALQGFLRDTESRSTDQDYRAGLTLSPTPRVSLTSHYGYRKKWNDYDHQRDEDTGGGPGLGYSAFILGRDLETHEFQTRLNYRPTPWLRTLLTYQLQSTDYRTDTDAAILGLPFDTPGGALLAGEYDSSIYSANVVLTPWQRVSLNGTFSYHDSRTRTADHGDPAVDDFEGDIYSLMVGGAYTLDDKTHLTAHYSFSRGDFSQDNTADGLPLGIEYQQHSLQAGISTEIGDRVWAQLQYRLQHYEEPSSGGFNDYTAHGIFLNFSIPWE